MLSIFEEAAQKSYSFPCVIIVLLDKLTQLFAGQLPYKLILLRYFTEDDEGSSDHDAGGTQNLLIARPISRKYF